MAREHADFTADQFLMLVRLLQKFANGDLDQWERWRFDTAHGEVCVRIDRSTPDDFSPSLYDDMTGWLSEQ